MATMTGVSEKSNGSQLGHKFLQHDQGQQAERIRPLGNAQLGVALGGGAARGLSHIGVLKTLTTSGVTFPIVTGTSMGAIIGAAYACGKLPEVEEMARAITPATMSGWLDINLHTGALKGDVVKDLFKQFVGDTTFADLRNRGISFSVVAADLDKEEPMYICEGRVDEAVRASMSIPGVFEPVGRDGRVLVDGGLIDNVPVEAARLLGAKLVIGVEVYNTYDIWARAVLRAGESLMQLRDMRARLRQLAREHWPSAGPRPKQSDEQAASLGLPIGAYHDEEGAPHDFTIPGLSRFRASLAALVNEDPGDTVAGGSVERGKGTGDSGARRREPGGSAARGREAGSREGADAEGRTSMRTTLGALDIIASVLEDGRLPFRATSEADVFIRPDVGKYHAHQFYRAPQIIAAGERAAREAVPGIADLVEATSTGLTGPIA